MDWIFVDIAAIVLPFQMLLFQRTNNFILLAISTNPIHLSCFLLVRAGGPCFPLAVGICIFDLIFGPVLSCLGLVRHQQQANQLLPWVNYTPHMKLVMFAKIGKYCKP
jgi:hypothetical protein